ncbi:hypothetical protein M885DRAFT_509485 [Pelagophyceae sp. CCMP2097]|nr:hypothetical protein M885DRAFT_509485 [Pelagophyceae sp. CCMP2097]|mmetsp:Transcript_32270/g.108699  ORF Transcript_32270/g.108699 Transcript_32270/m.108699 type:complete len:345 (+) Transcript_32270:127-1161(+)
MLLLCCASFAASCGALTPEAWAIVRRGGVHVERDFLSQDLVAALRNDAAALHAEGAFRADGLFRTTDDRAAQGFSDEDRQTYRRPWLEDVGDVSCRKRFRDKMDALRVAAAAALPERNKALFGGAAADEMTFNYYAPGAALREHLDEYHEEAKGVRGWVVPTRRCVTWLVYLNEDWLDSEGGVLRCYPRADAAPPVGASVDGDVQVGWLTPRGGLGKDEAVFLGEAGEGHVLYTAAGDQVSDDIRNLVAPVDFSKYVNDATRTFDSLATPCLDPKGGSPRCGPSARPRQKTLDVLPRAGTLVIFDSVAVPHEVLRVTSARPRLAATGWFHAALPGPAGSDEDAA